MIAVIDYKAGNLRSVEKALKFIGADVVVTQDPQGILKADGVILPGVGAFADCIESLTSAGLGNIIKTVIERGTPFLGICLGFQMLFDRSEEHGENGNAVRGLGIFRGSVRLIPRNMGLKVPHMGWNDLIIQKDTPLLMDLPKNPFVYFVHSYCVDAEDKSIVCARCRYGVLFDAAVSDGNVFGTQFHPEKSGDIGMTILKNFVKVVRER